MRDEPTGRDIVVIGGSAFGPRAVGVLLSGGLNGGPYGMMVVKKHGGLTIVQDSQEAEVPNKAPSAVECLEVDHRLPTERIASPLEEVPYTPVPPRGVNTAAAASHHSESTAGAMQKERGFHTDLWKANWRRWFVPRAAERSGRSVTATCCAMNATRDTPSRGEILLAEKADAIEAALWNALWTLDENAELSRRITKNARAAGQLETAKTFEEHAREAAERTEVIRKFLFREESKESAHGVRLLLC